MKIRDRIVEFVRVRGELLKPNPRNWRVHPPAQHDALRGVLAEIGYAGALLARRLTDGSLELIDGHLRAETTPDAEVPVLVLDLDEAEADKLLAVHDPLAGMAETNNEAMSELLARVETENGAVRAMLDGLLPKTGLADESIGGGQPDRPCDLDVPEAYQVVVECGDEEQQRTVFERLTAEGLNCRLLTL